MKLITMLVGKNAFEHVYGKGAIEVQYIIIIIIIKENETDDTIWGLETISFVVSILLGLFQIIFKIQSLNRESTKKCGCQLTHYLNCHVNP